MIVVPIISAAVGVLVASSARNMAQTLRILRMDKQSFTFSPPATTAVEAVSRMQSMKRKELLELFMACEAPSNISLVIGEWNGRLLENNGWILVRKEDYNESQPCRWHIRLLSTYHSLTYFFHSQPHRLLQHDS
jgi:hypothetical protein